MALTFLRCNFSRQEQNGLVNAEYKSIFTAVSFNLCNPRFGICMKYRHFPTIFYLTKQAAFDKASSTKTDFTSQTCSIFLSRIIPYETWLEQAMFNQVATDNESTTAVKLREALVLSRKKCQMDYLAQYDATNYQMRRRIYETERLKNELQWQNRNVNITRISIRCARGETRKLRFVFSSGRKWQS